MKKLLFFLLINLPLLATAQQSVAVRAQNGTQDLETIANVEGYPWNSGITSTVVGTATVVSSSTITNTVSYTCSILPPQQPMLLGRAVKLTGATVKYDKTVRGIFSMGANVTSAIPVPFNFRGNVDVRANDIQRFDVSGTLRSNQVLWSASITNVTDSFTGVVAPTIASTTSLTIGYTYNVSGVLLTDDLNITARYILDIWGDSLNDAQGATVTASMPDYQLSNYLIAKGYDVRRRNMSSRGSASGQHLTYTKEGKYNGSPPNMVLIALGTNDANSGVTQSTYVANIIGLVNFALARNPNAIVLVSPIPPIVDLTREATSSAFSAAVSTAITALNKPKVFYVSNVRTALVATDVTKFSADQVHYNDTGYGLIWTNGIKAFLDSHPTAYNLSKTVAP